MIDLFFLLCFSDLFVVCCWFRFFLVLVFLFLFVLLIFFLSFCFVLLFQVPVDHAVVLRERGVEVRMEFGGTEIAVSCYKQHDGDKLLDAKVQHALCIVYGMQCAVCVI